MSPAPQFFSQFPDPCAPGGTVTITVSANAPFPFHCTINWFPAALGGSSWTATATDRAHTIPVPEGASAGTVTEAAGKSLALAVNVA